MNDHYVYSEVQVIEAIRRTVRYKQYNHRIKISGNILLMYIAGTAQIDAAINKCGISNDTVRGILVYDSNENINEFLEKGYIKPVDRFIPFDKPEEDFDIFSRMAYTDLLLSY